MANPRSDTDYPFFSANSGLTPVELYSLDDHRHGFYVAQGGEALQDVDFLERQWLGTKVTFDSGDTKIDLWRKLRELV